MLTHGMPIFVILHASRILTSSLGLPVGPDTLLAACPLLRGHDQKSILTSVGRPGGAYSPAPDMSHPPCAPDSWL
eukprot:3208456-Pyramimonas_sp.AAC.1